MFSQLRKHDKHRPYRPPLPPRLQFDPNESHRSGSSRILITVKSSKFSELFTTPDKLQKITVESPRLHRLHESFGSQDDSRRLADVHNFQYDAHRERSEAMKAASLRHKHLQLDQGKLDRARRILGAKTETETLDRALSIVVSEADIDKALGKVRGKGRLRKVFR
jgi:hypothetical protein